MRSAAGVCGAAALALGGVFGARGAQNAGKAQTTPPITAETLQADREFLQRYQQRLPDASPVPQAEAQRTPPAGAMAPGTPPTREAMTASGRVEAEPPSSGGGERANSEEPAPAPIAEKSTKPRKVSRETEAPKVARDTERPVVKREVAEEPIAARDSAPPRRQPSQPTSSTKTPGGSVSKASTRSRAADVEEEPVVSSAPPRMASQERISVRRAVAVRAVPAADVSNADSIDEGVPRHHGFFHRIHIFKKDRDRDRDRDEE
jgi:hypothetical protein